MLRTPVVLAQCCQARHGQAGDDIGGTMPCARLVAASVSSSSASKSCKSNFKRSALMPDKPAAPPRRASRSALATARVESWTGRSGWYWSSRRKPRLGRALRGVAVSGDSSSVLTAAELAPGTQATCCPRGEQCPALRALLLRPREQHARGEQEEFLCSGGARACAVTGRVCCSQAREG